MESLPGVKVDKDMMSEVDVNSDGKISVSINGGGGCSYGSSGGRPMYGVAMTSSLLVLDGRINRYVWETYE